MKRTEAKSIAEIIGDFMQQEDIETTMLEHRALQHWVNVVGPGINRMTTERYVENGVITVKEKKIITRRFLDAPVPRSPEPPVFLMDHSADALKLSANAVAYPAAFGIA